MEKFAGASSHWWNERARGNFESGLFLLIAEGLFLDTPTPDFDVCIVGGFLSEDTVPSPRAEPIDRDGREREQEKRTCCWGCGLLAPDSLSQHTAERLTILAVRGPLTATALRLGGTVPVGEPALLLPALYQPRRDFRSFGKSVCVPQHDDDRSDREILEVSGCDLVLRAPLEPHLPAIYGFVDALASADFVLAGDFHGAALAAAYVRPFAFWGEPGAEPPFAWRDFSELLNIPVAIYSDLDRAKAGFADIELALRIPATWPILTRSPFPLKMSGVLGVLNYEMAAGICEGADNYKAALDAFSTRPLHFDRDSGRAEGRDAVDEMDVRNPPLLQRRSPEPETDRAQAENDATMVPDIDRLDVGNMVA
jgi:hypothetical protein